MSFRCGNRRECFLNPWSTMINHMDGTDRTGTDGAHSRDAYPPEAGPETVERQENSMDAVRPLASGIDQRPVSLLGWVIALAGGALLWLLVFFLIWGI